MRALAVFAIVVVGACSAAAPGHILAPDPKDRCKGHLDCGATGYCWSAQLDGEGWECLDPSSNAAKAGNACEYTGEGIGPADVGARRRDGGT